MVNRVIKIDRTPSGTVTMSAGGGAFHNTYIAQTVLKPTTTGYELKNAGFIKVSGHRASSTEQAIIPIEVNDVVVYLSGKLPITDQNPDAIITAYRITDIGLTIADAEQIPITHAEIPQSVIQGTEIYHNREGSYFCKPVKQEV
jgi:hypothetical protein